MKNTITWFEINVANLKRSIKFYNHVLETEIRIMNMDDFPAMGVFPDEGVNGALVEEEGYEAPEHSGVMLYFDGSTGIDSYLKRVEEAGVFIMVPRTIVTEDIGFWGAFEDLDGNVLAFFEPPLISK